MNKKDTFRKNNNKENLITKTNKFKGTQMWKCQYHPTDHALIVVSIYVMKSNPIIPYSIHDLIISTILIVLEMYVENVFLDLHPTTICFNQDSFHIATSILLKHLYIYLILCSNITQISVTCFSNRYSKWRCY